MKFSSVTNEKLSDKVISQIMSNIKSGKLLPGARLPNEPELATSFGVSRGILREALTILIVSPKRGLLLLRTYWK